MRTARSKRGPRGLQLAGSPTLQERRAPAAVYPGDTHGVNRPDRRQGSKPAKRISPGPRVGRIVKLSLALHQSTEMFLLYCRSRRLSDRTIDFYSGRLLAFSRFLGRSAPNTELRAITRQLIREFVLHEISRCSPRTVNHTITALRVFFRFMVADGCLPEDPTEGLEKVREERRIIEGFSQDQIEAILATCKTTFNDIRDRALILVMLDCGLRASETIGLGDGDIKFKERVIKVIGKGEKERLVAFGETTALALAQYQALRIGVAKAPEKFFMTCYATAMTRHCLRFVVARRCKKAGITGVRCSPHTFRHTFARQFLLSGKDMVSLQKLLGHSDMTMTRRYAEMSDQDALKRHREFSPADSMNLTKPRLNGRRKRLV